MNGFMMNLEIWEEKKSNYKKINEKKKVELSKTYYECGHVHSFPLKRNENDPKICRTNHSSV